MDAYLKKKDIKNMHTLSGFDQFQRELGLDQWFRAIQPRRTFADQAVLNNAFRRNSRPVGYINKSINLAMAWFTFRNEISRVYEEIDENIRISK